MNRRAMFKQTRIFVPLILSLSLAACGQPAATAPAEKPPLDGAAIGGPFTLVDKNRHEVKWSDFAGKYRMVYFGYTFCPDACPMDVQNMMQGYALFEKAEPALAKQVQPIFISIDPERDTPAAVGEFAANYSPRLLGLTGTPEQVKAAASKFLTVYAKGEQTSGGYLMEHTRFAFLMDRDGKPIEMLPVNKGPTVEKWGPKAVAEKLTKWVH